MHWDQPPTCTALSAPVRGERTQLCPAWSLLWVGASPASPLRVSSLSERHEHDARDQHPICTDEGEPAVLDSEGLPVQRCVPGCPLSPTTSPSLASRGLLTCGNRPPPLSAKVACVKSRDMHWALVAHRDQRDINLSSLRMLIVADGANPCKWQLPLPRGQQAAGLDLQGSLCTSASHSHLHLSSEVITE